MSVVTKLNISLKHFKSGKVRELYDLGENFLMIATDRISAFDHILPQGIPRKGEVLTQISLFWFDFLKDIIKNHLVESNFSNFSEELKQHPELDKRSVIIKKTTPFPIECVVRGYLAGSGWKGYKENGKVCGIELPKGLVESSKLSSPIFTPATKAESGHDMNISIEQAAEQIGEDAYKLQELSLSIYKKAADYALSRGIIIADTKFEFGKIGEEIILIDEALTPDSSRFWPADQYTLGKSQKSFDKQYVRDYLLSINWNREPPVPDLPEEVVQETSRKYLEAYEKLVGESMTKTL